MFASCRYRNSPTPATIPFRSGQVMRRTAVFFMGSVYNSGAEGVFLVRLGRRRGLGWDGRGDRRGVLLALHHVGGVRLLDRLLGARRVHGPARLGELVGDLLQLRLPRGRVEAGRGQLL